MARGGRGRYGALAVAALALIVAAVAWSRPGAQAPESGPRATLARLVTAPAGSMSTYSRDRFGDGWEDVDGNGCDTRNDILRRDLARPVLRHGSRCVVTRGVLHDPYSGRTIRFVRGVRSSRLVQIDHVVALADAWRTGAARWTAARRRAFANDPLELLAVDGGENQSKGDGDASQWLPPNEAYACAFAARQVAIKVRYRLWVTRAERAALGAVLDGC